MGHDLVVGLVGRSAHALVVVARAGLQRPVAVVDHRDEVRWIDRGGVGAVNGRQAGCRRRRRRGARRRGAAPAGGAATAREHRQERERRRRGRHPRGKGPGSFGHLYLHAAMKAPSLSCVRMTDERTMNAWGHPGRRLEASRRASSSSLRISIASRRSSASWRLQSSCESLPCSPVELRVADLAVLGLLSSLELRDHGILGLERRRPRPRSAYGEAGRSRTRRPRRRAASASTISIALQARGRMGSRRPAPGSARDCASAQARPSSRASRAA